MNAPLILDQVQAVELLRLTLNENALLRAERSPLPCTLSPALRAQLVQLCVQIRGRGDAGHLLPRVEKIERLMGPKP